MHCLDCQRKKSRVKIAIARRVLHMGNRSLPVAHGDGRSRPTNIDHRIIGPHKQN